MSFLGIGFLIGLAGIALPVAIHIFGKKRKVTQAWGAMRFLDEAKPNWKRRTLRLQDVLILLLRIAAVALLALAFARPVLKVPLPPEDVHELIMIVDRSPSTELGRETGRSLADEILERTSQILELAPADTRVRFFLNGTGSELQNLPPESGSPFNEPRNRNAWLTALKEQQPGSNTLAWPEAIRGVLNGPDTSKALSRQVVIIADAAKHGWPMETDGNSQNASSWVELTKAIPDCTVFFVPIGTEHPHRRRANLAIDHLDADQQRIQTGSKITLRATVSNRGAEPNPPAKARWTESADYTVIAEDTIPQLKPGEVHELVLNREFSEAGPIAIRLELEVEQDALSSDDVAAKVIEVVDRIPVAVFIDVPPDQLADPRDRFTNWTFAAAAGHPDSIAFGDHKAPLKSPPEQASAPFFEVTWLTPEQLKNTPPGTDSAQGIDSGNQVNLDEFAVVVWSVADASSWDDIHLSENLRRFVSEGGGLWLRPPSNVNAPSFNEIFFPHEFGMSPVGINTIQNLVGTTDNDSIGMRPPGETVPPIFSKAVLTALDELQLKRHLSLRDPRPPSSNVLLEFEGGMPFVMRRRLGKGEVILTTLDSNPESGNLAACVGYLPFVQELLWHLASPQAPPRNFSSTEIGSIKVPTNRTRYRSPQGEWSSLNSNRERSPFRAPGLYWVEAPGVAELEPISISRMPLESETRSISQVYLDRLNRLEGIEALRLGVRSDRNRFENQFARSEDLTTPAGHFEVKEIWAWFLVGLIGFLILEVILAHHLLTRRRSSLRTE